MPTPRRLVPTTGTGDHTQYLDELLIVHRALEGWVFNQHERTRQELRTLINKEAAATKREVAALRAEVRRLARKRTT